MRNLPTITKNLLLINVLVWFADIMLRRYGVVLHEWFGLHYLTAESFRWWQPLSYMFLHGSFSHLFCNMFAVLMFGPAMEEEWGSHKYLIYYIICGIGAALTQEAVWAIQLHSLAGQYADASIWALSNQMVTIGASGAVFGILLAFAWLFPDVQMFLLFLPIPIRARTFVLIYAAIELFAGFSSLPGDNVAHFAHLGGMLFGLICILIWSKKISWPKFRRRDDNEDVEDEGHKGPRKWHYQQRL